MVIIYFSLFKFLLIITKLNCSKISRMYKKQLGYVYFYPLREYLDYRLDER